MIACHQYDKGTIKRHYYPMTKKYKCKKVKKIKQEYPNDPFKHQCVVMGCSFKGKDRWDLKNHQIGTHYYGKKFYCQIGDCKSVFKTRSYLINHIIKTKHHVNKSPIEVLQQSQGHSIGTISAGEQQIPVMQGHTVSQYSKYSIVTLSYLQSIGQLQHLADQQLSFSGQHSSSIPSR